jgi:predicted secreted protein with PEFG-CTERM motif
VFTIRDASSGGPLRNSSYDFVILQNNNEIHRYSGNAQVGGDFKEFTFSKSQTGPTVIRFENIRGTGLSTEFGLVVVPEFGVIASLILLITLSIIIIINKKFRKMSYYGT